MIQLVLNAIFFVAVRSVTHCTGHYGPGGDDAQISDPNMKWCCQSCNCKDLSDKLAQCPSGSGQDDVTICSGHYGPGGDDAQLSDPDMKWCCSSCNCKDLSDALPKCPEGTDANGVTTCLGHYGTGGDGDQIMDADLKWCCIDCNCKDLSDKLSDDKCVAAEDANIATDITFCRGHYGIGGDDTQISDEDMVWCCINCNCKDLSDGLNDQTCDAVSDVTWCNGHYGNGGDDTQISDQDMRWCCDSCNCRDLNDNVCQKECTYDSDCGQSNDAFCLFEAADNATYCLSKSVNDHQTDNVNVNGNSVCRVGYGEIGVIIFFIMVLWM